jgi:hypothetical protein
MTKTVLSFIFIIINCFTSSAFSLETRTVKVFSERDTVYYHFVIQDYRKCFLSQFKDSLQKTDQTSRLDSYFGEKENHSAYDYLVIPSSPYRRHILDSRTIYRLLKQNKCKIEYENTFFGFYDFKKKKDLRGICSNVTRIRKQAHYKSCTLTFKSKPEKSLHTFRLKKINDFKNGCPF